MTLTYNIRIYRSASQTTNINNNINVRRNNSDHDPSCEHDDCDQQPLLWCWLPRTLARRSPAEIHRNSDSRSGARLWLVERETGGAVIGGLWRHSTTSHQLWLNITCRLLTALSAVLRPGKCEVLQTDRSRGVPCTWQVSKTLYSERTENESNSLQSL